MIRIFIIFIIVNCIFSEDKTAPEPMQIEPELESVNEIPSPDDMMLIWPKIPPSGDPKEVKKAIESQRLLDKIKHGAVALNNKNNLNLKNKNSKSVKSNPKVHLVSGKPLANALAKISAKGHIPLILINSPNDRLWHERIWLSYKTEIEPLKLLKKLAKTFRFTVRNDGSFYVLSSGLFSNRVYKPISINAEKISLVTLIKSILKSAGINGVVSENLRDVLVTVQLKKVPAIEALKAIVKASNLEYQIVSNVHIFHPNLSSRFNSDERHEVIKIQKRLD